MYACIDGKKTVGTGVHFCDAMRLFIVTEFVNIKTKDTEGENTYMSKKEIIKRYILFIISLFFAAFGVAITKHGELGVSPISSVPNVMSSYMTSFSLGTWLIIWNCILIVG